jgi:hypothetical protein
MSRTAVERVSWFILALGAAAALAAFLLVGREAGKSVAIGAGVAIVNWELLRFIVGRVVSGTVRNQAAFSFVLFIKLGGLMGGIFLLLYSGLVEPIAFAIGVSTLVLGALLCAFLHVLTAKAAESEP